MLHLAGAKRLAVFDVNLAQVVGSIPLQADGVHFAAGLEDVVVLQEGAGTIERFSMKTLDREVAAALPIRGVIKAVAMGSASNGPLLVHWAVGTQELDHATFTLIDPARMRVRENDLKVYPSLGMSYRDFVHLSRRPMDGYSACGARAIRPVEWAWSWRRNRAVSLITRTPPLATSFRRRTGGFFIPLTALPPQVSITGTQDPEGDPVLPAEHGDLFVRIGTAGNQSQAAPRTQHAPNRRRADAKVDTLTILTAGRDKPIAIVTGVDLPALAEDSVKHDFTFDKRVHLIPDAGS